MTEQLFVYGFLVVIFSLPLALVIRAMCRQAKIGNFSKWSGTMVIGFVAGLSFVGLNAFGRGEILLALAELIGAAGIFCFWRLSKRRPTAL
jgi:hypothetical protein